MILSKRRDQIAATLPNLYEFVFSLFSESVKRGGNGSGGGGYGSNGSVSVSGGVGVGVGVGVGDRVDNDGRRQQGRALFNFASFKVTKLFANEASADKLISVVEHVLSDW